MTVSVLQTVYGTDAAANGLTEAVTLTVTAGSSIHVGATIDSLTTFASIASVPVMTWTLRDDVNDTGNNQRLAHWTADGAASGSLVITVTNTILTDFRGCWASEIGGTSGYDAAASAAHAAQFQATPGTGTDAVTSGNTSALSTQPACVSAFCLNSAANATPSVGTGFTGTGSGFAVGGGTNFVTAEFKRVTATTAVAGTFTTTSNTGHLTAVAVFKESGGGGGDVTVGITGVAGTSAVGTLAVSHAQALTGVAGTSAVGTLVPNASKALFGNAGTSAVGSVTPSTTVALTGVAGTSAVGSVSTSNDVTAALTGVSGTASIGTLGPNTSVAVTGNAGTGQVGTLATAHSQALTGVAGTVAVGSVVPNTVVALTGVQATGQVGSVGVVGDVTVALTGVSITVSVGNLTLEGVAPPLFVGGGPTWFKQYPLLKDRKKKLPPVLKLEHVTVIPQEEPDYEVFYKYVSDVGPQLTELQAQMTSYKEAVAKAIALNEEIKKSKRNNQVIMLAILYE